MRITSIIILSLCAAMTFGAPDAARAEREPVLKQVSVPHPYYWREMYVPQLTMGPSSLAWSPKGHELVYSAAGRLWRQKVGSTRAEELTSGPFYDYQPDWSPDGKTIVFSRYDGNAIEICFLDLKSGKISKLTNGGDVNTEPRWSPDGTKIAFVTTEDTGKFHIAIAEKTKAGWTHHRWLPERVSEHYRYYYSEIDHEISPTWSPDGKSLIYVTNPEIDYGSGSLFRRPLDLSKPAMLVQEEETAWRARPDWSPDGRRVAYSSFARRQWGQLWLAMADGDGYPLAYSYGDFDVKSPRWSPDAKRIAYISNEGGTNHIVIQDVIGGKKTPLVVSSRAYRTRMGRLEFAIRDADGKLSPARVSILGADGRAYAPDGAMMHADDGFDRSLQKFETHYFHTDGSGEVVLPQGEATVTVWLGLTHAVETQKVTVGKGEAHVDITLRSLDPEGIFKGWVSADPHVHMNYGGAYRMTPEKLLKQEEAEDLGLIFNLIVNKEQRIPDIGYFTPTPIASEDGKAVLAESQEFHTSVWGHLGLIGLNDHVLMMDYAGYPRSPAASLYPDNAAVADLAHAQSALVGYVHPYDTAPDPFRDKAVKHALPEDVALGKIDYVEALGFSDHKETSKIWYRLLNCGFRLPAAGATDAMTNFASLRGPAGMNRTFVDVGSWKGDPETRERAWLKGLKAGKSFATNGPLLSLSVEGKSPGDEIRVKKGAHNLHYKAAMRSIVGVDRVEIVVNGEVAATLPTTQGGRRVDAEGEITVPGSAWVLLRAVNDHASPLVFDLYPYATTSPIYVVAGGDPVRSRDDADFFIKWMDRLKETAEASKDYNSDAERAAVLDHIARARKIFEKRR